MNPLLLATFGLLARNDALPIVVVLGVGGVVLFGSLAHNQYIEKVWRAFSIRNRLVFSGGGWFSGCRVSGRVDERPIKVWTFSRGSGKQRTHHSAMALQISGEGVPRGLHIYRETFFSKVGKVFGGQDIEVRDPNFDKAFMIKGDRESDVRAWLTYDRRQAIISLRKYPGFELSQTQLYVERKGTFNRAAELDTLLLDLTRCADGIA